MYTIRLSGVNLTPGYKQGHTSYYKVRRQCVWLYYCVKVTYCRVEGQCFGLCYCMRITYCRVEGSVSDCSTVWGLHTAGWRAVFQIVLLCEDYLLQGGGQCFWLCYCMRITYCRVRGRCVWLYYCVKVTYCRVEGSVSDCATVWGLLTAGWRAVFLIVLLYEDYLLQGGGQCFLLFYCMGITYCRVRARCVWLSYYMGITYCRVRGRCVKGLHDDGHPAPLYPVEDGLYIMFLILRREAWYLNSSQSHMNTWIHFVYFCPTDILVNCDIFILFSILRQNVPILRSKIFVWCALNVTKPQKICSSIVKKYIYLSALIGKCLRHCANFIKRMSGAIYLQVYLLPPVYHFELNKSNSVSWKVYLSPHEIPLISQQK